MSLADFLIASGIAFWALFGFSMGMCVVAVVRAIRQSIRAIRRLDPIHTEAAKGITEVEQYLAGGDS